MVYQMDAYRYWEARLGRNDFSFGQFGEDFTVAGLPMMRSFTPGIAGSSRPLVHVHYDPDPLEPPATGNLLICCSRPSSEVEVDL